MIGVCIDQLLRLPSRPGAWGACRDGQHQVGCLSRECWTLDDRTVRPRRFTALFTFPEERKMLLKERASGMYRLSAFYFARLASDLPMCDAPPPPPLPHNHARCSFLALCACAFSEFTMRCLITDLGVTVTSYGSKSHQQCCCRDFAVPTVFIILMYFIGGLRVDSGVYFFQNWCAAAPGVLSAMARDRDSRRSAAFGENPKIKS